MNKITEGLRLLQEGFAEQFAVMANVDINIHKDIKGERISDIPGSRELCNRVAQGFASLVDCKMEHHSSNGYAWVRGDNGTANFAAFYNPAEYEVANG